MWASDGTSSITAEKWRWVMSISEQSVSHVTVAVRGPWSSSEKPADDGARPEGGHLLAVAAHRDGAVEDDERLTPRLALVDDHRARGHRDLVTGFGDLLQILGGTRCEE